MKLGSRAQGALATWLGASWESNHPFDMDRWYDFVNEFSGEHGYHINETDLEGVIELTLNRHLNDEMRKIIRDRIFLACSILSFLRHTGR